jgi:hypothetical protein
LSELESKLKDMVPYLCDEDFMFSKSPMAMEKWRRFFVSLMHHRLVKIHLPYCFMWKEKNTVEFVKLMEEIGAKCPGLRLFEFKHNPYFDIRRSPNLNEKVFPVKQAFFRALPQLVNLQVVHLYIFHCDDWALQQFGEHGANIV